MKVSERSWHYRLHVLVFTCFHPDYGPHAYFKGRRYGHKPRTLCGYFWSTATLVALGLVLGPVFALALGVLFAVFSLASGGKWLKDRYRDKRPAKAKPPKAPKEPGMVTTYIKSRKRKLCPLIEITE